MHSRQVGVFKNKTTLPLPPARQYISKQQVYSDSESNEDSDYDSQSYSTDFSDSYESSDETQSESTSSSQDEEEQKYASSLGRTQHTPSANRQPSRLAKKLSTPHDMLMHLVKSRLGEIQTKDPRLRQQNQKAALSSCAPSFSSQSSSTSSPTQTPLDESTESDITDDDDSSSSEDSQEKEDSVQPMRSKTNCSENAHEITSFDTAKTRARMDAEVIKKLYGKVQPPPGFPSSIKQFNHNTLDPNLHYLICGSGGAGKTSLLMNLLYLRKADFVMTIVFTPEPTVQKIFRRHLPTGFIYDDLETYENQFIQIVDCARILAEVHKLNVRIIWDDMMTLDNAKIIKRLLDPVLKKSRHSGISMVILSQEPLAMPKQLRSLVHYFILLKAEGDQIDDYWKCYVKGHMKKPEYDAVASALTKTKGYCLIIDKMGPEPGPSWFKFVHQEALPKFVLCNRDFWKLWLAHAYKESSHKSSRNRKLIGNVIQQEEAHQSERDLKKKQARQQKRLAKIQRIVHHNDK